LLTLVDLHRISLTYVTNKKGGDQVIDTERMEFERLHRKEDWPNHFLQSDLITGAVDAEKIGAVVKRAQTRPEEGEQFLALNDTLRSVIATSAVSHGVDVEELNAMFFAGMPSDIAEYIQASSRVGRSHVGFCVLIPVPQRARDRFVVEIHDIFHRFLERMILPASVDRWAEKALLRVIPSFFQAGMCGAEAIKEFAASTDADKKRAHLYSRASDVREWIAANPAKRKAALAKFVELAYGLRPGFMPPGAKYYEGVVMKQLSSIEEDIETPRYATSELRYFFENRSQGRFRPMTSLRDVDEPGVIVPSSFDVDGHTKLSEETLDATMRFMRGGSGTNIDDASPKDESAEGKDS
jgi:Helicase conserved C-terminal domain